MMARSTLSIRSRLALLTCVVLLSTALIFVGTVYREGRLTAVATASQRLAAVTDQLAGLLSSSARQQMALLRTFADDPEVRAYLDTGPTPDVDSAVSRRIERFGTRNAQLAALQLWNPQGEPVLSSTTAFDLPDSARRATIALLPAGDEVATGPLRSVGDTVAYPIVAHVVEGNRLLGYAVEWRRLAVSPQWAKQLADLVGSQAALYLGNNAGDVWSNLSRRVPAPPLDVRSVEPVVEYDRPGAGRQLAAARTIGVAPWTLLVEFPHASALAPITALLQRLAAIALVVALLGIAGAWAASKRLVGPLSTLARAARGIAGGDYSRQVPVHGTDEIADLSLAFNRMSDGVRDVREQLEEKVRQLEDSEARYRMLFNGNPHPMWVYDVETLRFLAVNDAAVLRYGYDAEEFLGMTVAQIRPPEDAAEFVSRVRTVRGGTTGEGVARHQRKDGTILEVEVTSHELTMDGRRARLVLAVDVTEKRRAEARLRDARQQLEHAVSSSGAVLYRLRVEGTRARLEWISDNVSNILGYSTTDALAANWWFEHVHPQDLPGILNGTEQVPQHDTVREYRFRHGDDSYRWVRDDQRVIAGDAGAPVEIIGAWTDLTERRQLEDQLRQSQKLEAVGHLAGGIAHDFNNLLSVIFAECDLALGEPRQEDSARHAFGEISRAAQRATLLTRQLLTFSRKQLVEPSVLHANDVVANLNIMLTRLIGEHVEYRTRLAPDLAPVIADRGLLEQVLVNLAVNARDAMPDGGSLFIETSNVTLGEEYTRSHAGVAPGEYVMIAVSDTGAGMTEEVQAHLFEPFFTTKEPGKGTGLGLATCYGIVRQFGGHIGVYSELRVGTIMKVYLPRARVAEATLDTRTLRGDRGGTETILLVEDEPQLKALAARILRQRGYSVLEAGDGREALRVLENTRSRVDLLLTDVVLPRMGGRALAERAATLRPGLRVLFMSGYTDDVIIQHRLLAQGIALLQKPFTADTIARKVREALDVEPVAAG
jgi:PAS domain S-box-containing protein